MNRERDRQTEAKRFIDLIPNDSKPATLTPIPVTELLFGYA